MKKFTAFIISTIFLLFSCSQISQPATQDFTFELSSEFVDGISRAMERSAKSTDQLTIKITLSGEVSQEKTITASLDQLKTAKVSLTFEKIELNKTFDVLVQVFIFGDELIFSGESKGHKLSENSSIQVEVREQDGEYILFTLMQDSYSLPIIMGLFKPYDIEKASTADFLGYLNEENKLINAVISDTEFDAQGNLWILAKDLSADFDDFFIYKKNNNDYIPVRLQKTPELFAIDKKTNKLITYYSEGDDRKFNIYNINPNGTSDNNVLTNTYKTEEGNSYFETTETSFTIKNVISEDVDPIQVSKCFAAYNNVLYIGYSYQKNSDPWKTYIYSYSITSSSSRENSFPSSEDDKDYSGFDIYDMIEQDGYLYVLMNFNGNRQQTPPSYDDHDQFLINSTGCVVKINLSNPTTFSSFTSLGLSSIITKSATLPLCYEEGNPQSKAYTQDNAIARKEINFSFWAPTSINEKNFFGPIKIIAIRPKRLVIADSGLFCYVDDDNSYYQKVDRIVNVDLEKFAITNVQQVGIDFTQSSFSNVNMGASYSGCLYDESSSQVDNTNLFVILASKSN